MSQPAFEMTDRILELWKIAVQSVMFLALWASVFNGKKEKRAGIAAVLFILVNIGFGLLSWATWGRYTASVAIALGYCAKRWKKELSICA